MRTASFLLALTMGAAAGQVQLSGTVVDEFSRPVAGATVSIEGAAASVLTDDLGAFEIAGTVLSASRRPAASGLRVDLRSRTVRLEGADASTTLDVFQLGGRKLASGIVFHDGVAELPRTTSLALVLRVREAGKPSSVWTGAGSAWRSASVAAAVLRVAKDGYLADTIEASSSVQSGLRKTLVANAPWIPSGALEHAGGQVRIRAGGTVFAMGSRGEHGISLPVAEGPVHSVRFTSDYWMDTTETTQKLFDSVMVAGYGAEAYGSTYWPTDYGRGDAYPAYAVSPGGAMLFANARSRLAGLDTVYAYAGRDGANANAVLSGVVADLSRNGFRLPTEAEWEYAARGGTSTDAYWGDQPSVVTDSVKTLVGAHATWAGNSYDLELGDPAFGSAPVASHAPNAYGLHDMLGNLTEWCQDHFTDGYDAGQAVDPVGPAEGDYHAMRGGNWGNGVEHLRAANRTFAAPAYELYFEGFRTVRKAP